MHLHRHNRGNARDDNLEDAKVKAPQLHETLGKVDPFPSFLLEMAHNEASHAIAPQAGNGLVADICRRDNRLCSGAI